MIKNSITGFNGFAKKHNLYLFALPAFAAIIMVLSVVPGCYGGINSGVSAHGLAYFVLSATAVLYFRGAEHKNPLLKSVLLAGSYGCLIEIIQYFIPSMCFDFMDILVNCLAALTALVPSCVLMRKGWI